jgi:hypothetical protein
MLFVSIKFLSSLYPLGLFSLLYNTDLYSPLCTFYFLLLVSNILSDINKKKGAYMYSIMLQDVEDIYIQRLWTITKIDKYWKKDRFQMRILYGTMN